MFVLTCGTPPTHPHLSPGCLWNVSHSKRLIGPIHTIRHVSVPSPFRLRSVRTVSVHTVRRVQSPTTTARDRRPAIICIKYAARCHGMNFPLFVIYWNFGGDRMIVSSKCEIKKHSNLPDFFSTLNLFVPIKYNHFRNIHVARARNALETPSSPLSTYKPFLVFA